MILKNVNMQFQINFEDNKEAEIVFKALEPEIGTLPSLRSSAESKLEDKKLTINITAEDITSLRAAINSNLRWIILSHEIIKLTSI